MMLVAISNADTQKQATKDVTADLRKKCSKEAVGGVMPHHAQERSYVCHDLCDGVATETCLSSTGVTHLLASTR